MIKIVYTRSDGALILVHPVAKHKIEEVLGPMTEEDYKLHLLEKSVPPDATNVAIMDASNIPSDRTFRDAWDYSVDKSMLVVDMEKARVVHMDGLKRKRKAQLEKLDVDMMREVEASNTGAQATIAKVKQMLRDMPQTFDLNVYATPDELKNAKPDYLDD